MIYHNLFPNGLPLEKIIINTAIYTISQHQILSRIAEKFDHML